MKSAYNEQGLYNLLVTKEVKRWWKQDYISDQQLDSILAVHKSPFYHPNLIIRVLLFIATLIALSGVTGLFLVLLSQIGEAGLSIASIVYGLVSFLFLKLVFIDGNHHYKSGVTEALLYHACSYTLGGIAVLSDLNPHVMLFLSLIVFSYMAIRFLDLISTLASVICLASLVFYEFYNLGGIVQQIIPFIFIVCFTPVYWFAKRIRSRKAYSVWSNNLILLEALSLILIYLAGNYLVVRELSVNLMNLDLQPGQDIPFAFLFYGLTVLLPIGYLYFGIKNKDVVLLRVSLALVACSAITFKYYYGFGHPEISLTAAGAILLIISISLFRYLKTIRAGFTRENLLAEKWGDANLQAFIISQTLGGNQVAVSDSSAPGGGEFGGGGASGSF